MTATEYRIAIWDIMSRMQLTDLRDVLLYLKKTYPSLVAKS